MEQRVISMKKYQKYAFFVSILFILAFSAIGCASGPKEIDYSVDTDGDPTYSSNSKSKEVEIKGSDTLLQMVSNLAEAYSKIDSEAKISVTGGGSGTGIAALINGEIDIADASRQIKDSEIALAKEQGFDIYEVIVGRDALSVIVHESNAVMDMVMEDIGKIFRGEITNWQDVDGKDMDITLYGRQSTSGTYAFFMEHVLKGDYAPTMRNLEGNQAILEAVQMDKTGIGYVGLGYIVDESGTQVDGINVISVASSEGEDYISPLDESLISAYPISRALYQYTAGLPDKGSVLHKFIEFEISEEGQAIVESTGFLHYSDDDSKVNDLLMGQLS